jgi:hypothetical protein
MKLLRERSYGCRCSNAVFFRNSHCLRCDTPLGYEPNLGQVFPLAPGSELDTWHLAGPSVPANHTKRYRRCANLNMASGCNWLVEAGHDAPASQPYCLSCRLNRTIPDLSLPENIELWTRVEHAKRGVVSALVALGLPILSKVTEDPDHGLAFDFLRSPANGPRVLTGHNNGLITLNIDEADDLKREQMRMSMHEPYRTLMGHLRHEVGHYYWDRLVVNSRRLDEFRGLFGDEREDYESALQRHYREGPKPNWPGGYVSAYASVHPWEDWAETWAHYMHMIDTLGAATSFGLRPENIAMPFDCFGADVLHRWDGESSERFLWFLNAWLKLAAVMNELCRSMGQADFYPFVLPRAAVTKLHFVHIIICEANA